MVYDHELEKGKGGWKEGIGGKARKFSELFCSEVNSVHINSLMCRKDTTCF